MSESGKLSDEKLLAIQGRSAATHLDYPLSRAVSDVKSLLLHIEAIEAENKQAWDGLVESFDDVMDEKDEQLRAAEQLITVMEAIVHDAKYLRELATNWATCRIEEALKAYRTAMEAATEVDHDG